MHYFEKITHLLMPFLCTQKARWKSGGLMCPCGDCLALRYSFDGIIRVFIYPPFRKFKNRIMAIPQEDNEVIGAVCFDDFDAFMQDLKFVPIRTNPSDDEIDNNIQEDTYNG